MKRSLVVLLVLILAVALYARKPVNFSGTWQLDMEKSQLADARLWLDKIVVMQTKDSLLTERTYKTENWDEYPFTENLTLDGAEHEITIYDMPRKAAAGIANKKKNIVITSEVTFWGDNGEVTIPNTETWSLTEKGKVLSIDYTTVSQDGQVSGKLLFNKAE